MGGKFTKQQSNKSKGNVIRHDQAGSVDGIHSNEFQWPKNDVMTNSLYLEIKSFLMEKEYLRLMNCSKELFSDVKYHTRKIRLFDNSVINMTQKFLENIDGYQDLVLSKIKDPATQLRIDTNNSQAFIVLEFPNCEISINTRVLENYYDWDVNLSNRSFVKLSGPNKTFSEFLRVENVRVMRIHYFSNLSSVLGLSQLQELTLSHCPMVSDLSSLSKLHSLTIVDCKNVSDLKGLGSIRELTIWDCPGVTSIEELTTENYSLNIRNCVNVKDIRPIFRATRINTDAIESKDQLTSSSFLPHTRSFTISASKRLKLFEYPFPPSSSNSSEVVGHLYSLQLFHCITLKRLVGLTAIPFVELNYCPSLEDISCLGKNQRVSISHCAKIIDFSCLKNVKRVKLIRCEEFRHPTEVENVFHLTIDSCPFIKATELARLKKVHHLELVNVPIVSAKGINKVAVLEVYSPGTSTDLSALSSLTCENQLIVTSHDVYLSSPLSSTKFTERYDCFIDTRLGKVRMYLKR